jgi:hypothetical protein
MARLIAIVTVVRDCGKVKCTMWAICSHMAGHFAFVAVFIVVVLHLDNNYGSVKVRVCSDI